MDQIGKALDFNHRIHNINSNTAQELFRHKSADADFEKLLKERLNQNDRLQFSKHAQERVEQREIRLTDDLLSNLNEAVSKARGKGARDVLIFDARNAFIVNVPNNTVITAMNGNELKENVFTNIDSAVIL